MRFIVFACLLFAAALPPAGAALAQAGRYIELTRSETRQVGAFDTIAVYASLELTISRSQEPSLQVTAPLAVLRTLTTTIERGRLTIRLPDMTDAPPIRVTVSIPSLRAIEIAGAALVQATDINTDTLAVALTGSGVITLGGQVERLAVSLGGSGVLDLARLKARHATLDFTGSGEVHVYASQSVQVQLSGAGRIVIAGNPKQRSVAQPGSGQIVFR
jgi:hypothetical protein